MDNYLLQCSGDSISNDGEEVACSCMYMYTRDTFPIYTGRCDGFVLDTSSEISERAIIVAIAVSLILVICALSLLIITSVCITVYCLIWKKDTKVQGRDSQWRLFTIRNRNSTSSVHHHTVQPVPPATREENAYSGVNFNDYDYVDPDAEYSYSSDLSNKCDDLYERIRRGGSSAPSMNNIEDKMDDIRRTASKTNRLGTVSHILVPSSEQRSSVYSNATSFTEYVRFSSHSSAATSVYKTPDPIYLEPSSNMGELYNQMSDGQLMEINKDTITIGSKLGSGEFGSVHTGLWESPIGDLQVALKITNKADEQTRTAFLQEAAILGQFSHPNILRLVGVVTLTAPNMIVTELMQEELKRFLLSLQTQHQQDVDYETIAPHFLSFSRQVASGMQHLAQRECIHRDIAARNILLTDKCVCKIGDFGMSRRLETESDYYKVKGSHKLPIKWSAPEAIFFKRYTLKSDVWSYGMLLYEIWSMGRKPWPYEDNRSAVEKMARAANLPPPAGCPRSLYQLMVSTWHPKPDQRPDMNEVVSRLSLPDEELLARPELEGKEAASAPAFTLGADPMSADELYKDLQTTYVNSAQLK